MKKSFNGVYEQVYKESFEELEALRSDIKQKGIIIIISLVVFSIVLFSIICGSLFISLRGILIIVLAGSISIPIMSKRQYIPMFKEKVIGTFVKSLDEDLQYKPNEGISSSIYRMGEFEGYDKYYTEDLITGVLDEKYNFQMAEVETKKETRDTEGEWQETTVFHGLFAKVQCAKNIGTKIKIHSDKGTFGEIFNDNTKVKMDSQEFERFFDVYGDNKIIVMQILTAEVMATMMDFIRNSGIIYELTIDRDQMYLRFHTGTLFEPKIFKNSLDYDMLKKYYDIIDFVYKVTREINSVIEKTDI